jgi:hypothetical protein
MQFFSVGFCPSQTEENCWLADKRPLPLHFPPGAGDRFQLSTAIENGRIGTEIDSMR